MKQFVHDYTMVHYSTIDLCFSTHDAVISILWNHWSDHKIISFRIYGCDNCLKKVHTDKTINVYMYIIYSV